MRRLRQTDDLAGRYQWMAERHRLAIFMALMAGDVTMARRMTAGPALAWAQATPGPGTHDLVHAFRIVMARQPEQRARPSRQGIPQGGPGPGTRPT